MNKKIKITKDSKIILSLLIIYSVIVVAIFLPPYLHYKFDKSYIITDRYMIKYEYGKWELLKDSKDYQNKTFKVYKNGLLIGNYKVVVGKKILLIDDNEEKVKYDGNVFAHSGLKVGILNYSQTNVENSTDSNAIRKAISKVHKENLGYSMIQKYLINIDNDSDLEAIYHVILSNEDNCNENTLDGICVNSQNEYYLLFVSDGDDIDIIDEIPQNNELLVFEILDMFDIKEDGSIEILYSKHSEQEVGKECLNMYNLSKRKVINNFCEK